MREIGEKIGRGENGSKVREVIGRQQNGRRKRDG